MHRIKRITYKKEKHTHTQNPYKYNDKCSEWVNKGSSQLFDFSWGTNKM